MLWGNTTYCVKFRDEDSSHYLNRIESTASRLRTFAVDSRPSDHYFRSVSWFVCLFVCLFVQTAEFFSAIVVSLYNADRAEAMPDLGILYTLNH